LAKPLKPLAYWHWQRRGILAVRTGFCILTSRSS